MKRFISLMLMAVLLFCTIPVRGSAVGNQVQTFYFEDGSYMTVEVITNGARASGSKSGSKPYTYYDSDGKTLWKATLTGSFTYNGSTATCTSSRVDVTIYDSTWHTASKSSNKSGNTASASVTMEKRQLGITVTSKSGLPYQLTDTWKWKPSRRGPWWKPRCRSGYTDPSRRRASPSRRPSAACPCSRTASRCRRTPCRWGSG